MTDTAHADRTGTSGDDVLTGTAGDDTLSGLRGNDVLYGRDGADHLDGGGGHDRLFGEAGEDWLEGGFGNDRLYGGNDADRLYGDAGDDQIFGQHGHDIAHGGDGNDRIVGDIGRDTLYGDDGDDELDGGDGADRLFGGAGDDAIDGGAGDDLISGNDGHDTAHGGDGNDRMIGGTGRDALFGEAGNDTLIGEDGGDRLFGGLGNDDIDGGAGFDQLVGNEGHDTIHGGDGRDRIFGNDGRDQLYGDADDDKLYGGNGADQLHGGDGRDQLDGGDANDALYGDAGNDRLTGGLGDDALNGGAGNDTAIFSGDYADYAVLVSGTTATVTGADGSDTLTSIEFLQFDDRRVRVVLDPVSENPPVITSAATASVAENQTAAYTVTATDADGVLDTLVYSLSGSDAALFDIDSATGVVTFKAAPDYEAPGDTGGDNVYDIAVLVYDGHTYVGQYVSIEVTNQFESLDLSTLAADQGFIIQGDVAGDYTGYYVSDAGDLNGDGLGDIVIGTLSGDDGGLDAGEAYVVFGSASGFGTDVGGRQVIDLTNLTPGEGFIVQGETGDTLGQGVSSAGDVNGDGIDDLIVGGSGNDAGAANAGASWVIFGSTSGFGAVDGTGRAVLDIASLSAAEGFIIQGAGDGDSAGSRVSDAGDLNGDGYDDLIVAAWRGDDGGVDAGQAYVVFGSATGFGTDVGGRQVIDLATLSAAEGYVIQGDAAGDWAGWSISSAGDLNGDGFDDLVVGAENGSDGGTKAGEAYVIFGSAGSVGVTDGAGRQVIDLTTLSAGQGFIIQGDYAGDRAGVSVSNVGDINGDGYEDLIVGANLGDDGGPAAGEAYVILGSASGFGTAVDAGDGNRQVVDLTTLSASEGFIIQGENFSGLLGRGVESAGDVNGDGFDDFIVGAPFAGGYGGNGEAYVVFGGAAGFGVDVSGRQVLDLTALTLDQGFEIFGDSSKDYTGLSVSAAGDINGDGFDDVLVGAWGGDDGGTDAGEAYVIFGAATGSTAGITAAGTSGANTIIGGVGNDTLTGAGGADVIRSGAGDDVIGISDNGFFRIDGGRGDDTLRVDGAGVHLNFSDIAQNAVTDIERIDLTGSGNNRLTLTALDIFDMMEAREGGAAVLHVTGNAGDVVDLTEAGWVFAGQTSEDAITYDRYTNGNAEVRVQDGVTVIEPTELVLNLANLSASEGFVVQGYDGGWLGSSVSSAGDINGDGYGDLIVGAPQILIDGYTTGSAFVVFGSTSVFGVDVGDRQVIDLTTLSAVEGFIIQGDGAGDEAGVSVSSAGDINGDGYDDLIVGAPSGDDGGGGAGEAYVVFGSASGFGAAVDGRQVFDQTTLSATEGFILQGDAAQDHAGMSVSSAGDVNGDGYDDLIIGANYGDDGGNLAGEAYVVFGSASEFGIDVNGRQVVDLTTLSGSQGFIIQGDVGGDNAGWSVSSSGDINGDGYDDLIVGADHGDDGGNRAGEAYVVFGSAAGFGVDVSGRQVIDLTTLTAAEGFIIQGNAAFDRAGHGVSSAGDINGDGYDDLVVGADWGGYNAGEAYVVFGSASGFGVDVSGRQVIDLTTLGAAQGFVIQGVFQYGGLSAQLGYSVSSAGDFNGDGFDDLIVGDPFGDDGGSSAGAAYVIFGGGAGFGVDVSGRQVLDLASFTTAEGFIIQGSDAYDRSGESVSSAGDVNGDGYDDLIVGAPFAKDGGGATSGEAYVIFGHATDSTAGINAAGTSGANTIIGGAGDDTLAGNGGADVIRSGAGDDIIGVSDNAFFRIDGGGGDDTLRVDGAGVNLNFSDIAQNAVTDIERIDLTGSGDNSLTVSSLDIFDMMEAREGGSAVLRVTGDAGDAAYLSDAGWASTGQTVEGSVTYNTYTNGNAQAWVEDGVAVTLGSSGPSLTPADAGKAEIAPVMAVLDADAGTDALPGPGFGIDLGQIGWDSHGFLMLGDGGGAPVRAFGRDGGGWTSLSADTPWGDQHHLPDAHGGRFLHHRPAEIAIGQDLAGPGAVNDVPLPAAIELPGFAILSHDALPVSVPVFGHPPGPASGFPAADTILFAGDTPFDVTPAEAIEGWH